MSSTYVLTLQLRRELSVQGRSFDREGFFDWLWAEFGMRGGLVGVHEGTVLSEQAAQVGLETDSWTVDSGEAPRERDWIGGQEIETAELYFDSIEAARAARARIEKLAGLQIPEPREQKAQDWDAEWKASFQGAEIPPYWRILPPWVDGGVGSKGVLRINPGAGFGTGTHETTQLCLAALAQVCAKLPNGLDDEWALDFGSGSGILSIALARLGARVDAVEIDPLANENAKENAALNELTDRVRFHTALEEIGDSKRRYPVVVANILKPVLLQFADALCSRLAVGGAVVLSGLIESDVSAVSERYAKLLGARPEVRALGEWRALVWMPRSWGE